MKKGFTPILIVLLVIILVVIGLFLSRNSLKLPYLLPFTDPSPSATTSARTQSDSISETSAKTETANWKTYTGEKTITTARPEKKSKFSVKYPPDWTYQENALTTFFLPPGEIYTKGKIPKSIYISVRDKNSATLPVYIKYKTLREVKVGNETVNVLKAENYATDKYHAEIMRGEYFFTFSSSTNLEDNYDETFDKILSTIKFTE